MKVITIVDGHCIRELLDPKHYDENAEARQSSNFECKTRYKCCECMLVERDARLYPCVECEDNMLVRVGTGITHFIPRDSDGEEAELETLLFKDE